MSGKFLRIICALLLVTVACSAACADDSGYVRFDGNYFRPALLGLSGGEWSELVEASLPFQMPEEGTVILLRCLKLGSQISPEELSGVVAEFRLFNRQTGRYLAPVSAITVPETSSTFDLIFYENAEVSAEDYSLFCEGEEYTFEKMYRFRPETQVLRNPPDVLPTMPPEGAFLQEYRPEYCEPAERLLRQSDQGQLPVLNEEIQFGEKIAVVVFDSQDTVWKTTLDTSDPVRDLFPAQRLAASWEEADTLVLIRRNAVTVGNYGTHGSAKRVDALVTVVDMGRTAMYPVYTAASGDPPASISTNSAYTGGAEGEYKYAEAVEQIAQKLN